jgi:catabolite regulation protein CreA
MSSLILIIYGEEPQGTSSRRIMLKKEAKEMFANSQSMILKKSGMVKIFKLKRLILCSLFDLEYR